MLLLPEFIYRKIPLFYFLSGFIFGIMFMSVEDGFDKAFFLLLAGVCLLWATYVKVLRAQYTTIQ